MTQAEILKKHEKLVSGAIAPEACTCPAKDCPAHQKCWACVEFHRDYAKKPLPHCLRSVPGVQFTERKQ
jgi:hypothetical protein